ncbi:MAG: ABC transporter permease [Oscillospiraceae bacterium]|nr:ABC transporter permease [Oscillospiraceae bacterium]
MKSKTSYFNRTLFFNLLRRNWPIFAAYLIIWLVILPINLANMIQYYSLTMAYSDDALVLAAAAGRNVLSAGLYGGVIMSGIFGMLIAMAAFSYLYNARSVSMMCSLPIKREGVFLSVFTSGLAAMFVINIIIFLITLCVEAAYGMLSLGIGYVLSWLAMVCFANLFFFGFASLCASFTGNVFALPLVYIVLNFTVYVVEYLVKTVMRLFIYGVSTRSADTFMAFSPPVYLLYNTNFDSILDPSYGDTTRVAIGYTYDGWLALGIYAAVGIAFAILAMVIIKRRRMEAAGDVVALKPLKPVFKYCLSVGCALVLGIIIYEAAFSSFTTIYGTEAMLFMLLFMLFGAFVGYFAAEMLMQKTLHVFSGRNWAGIGITALLISALMVCGEYDVFGIERKLPDADEIKGVSIQCAGEPLLLEQSQNIKAAIKVQSDIISHKDLNEAYTGNYDEDSRYVSFVYTYKNGKTFSREYNVYTAASKDIYTLNDLLNVKEAVDYRKELSVPVTVDTIADSYVSYFDKTEGTYKDLELTAEQAYQLYTECILPDIDDGSLGRIWLVNDDSYYSSIYDCTINFSVEKRLSYNNYKSDYFYTTLTTSSERTKQWLADNLGLDPCTMSESRDILNTDDMKAYAEKAGYRFG